MLKEILYSNLGSDTVESLAPIFPDDRLPLPLEGEIFNFRGFHISVTVIAALETTQQKIAREEELAKKKEGGHLTDEVLEKIVNNPSYDTDVRFTAYDRFIHPKFDMLL